MNRFVVAEPLWCTGCNTCLAACSDVHKTQGLQQHPRLALAKTSTLQTLYPTVRGTSPPNLLPGNLKQDMGSLTPAAILQELDLPASSLALIQRTGFTYQ